MDIKQEQHGAVMVLTPQGPLVQADASAFATACRRAATANLGRVVIDLGATPYADSAGLESILDLSDELANTGRVLKVCAPNQTLREVFDLTGVSESIDQFEDASSAVRSFL